MRSFFKNNLKYWKFVLLSTLFCALFFSLPEFTDNPANGLKGGIILFFHWILINLSAFFLIYLFSANKYVFAIVFPVYCLIGSLLSYFRVAFKATLTPMLIDAARHNDTGTTLDLISPYLIIYTLLCLGVSVLFVRYRLLKTKNEKWYLHIAIAVAGLGLLLNTSNRVTSSIMQRFPLSVYENIKLYNTLNINLSKTRIDPDPHATCTAHDTLNVVFVIGESLRADHLQLNGYARQTNPLLSKRTDIVSLPRIFSDYTNTNMSLPHILTRADSTHPERAYSETSFVSLFKSGGFHTTWISNQDPAETYITFIKECDTVVYAHPEKSVYNYNNWYDSDLLPYLKKTIKQGKNNLMILHTIGSHWYYNNHFPEKSAKFKPVTDSRIIAQCSKDEIINSYDNTVLYTDFFIDSLIRYFENTNTIILFLSDHGEVLGEDGLWLHAGDHSASKNPACLIWMSGKYRKNHPEKMEALQTNKLRRFKTDFMFHSILSAGCIRSASEISRLNVFALPESSTQHRVNK